MSAVIRTLPGVDLSITHEEYRAVTDNELAYAKLVRFAQANFRLNERVIIARPPVLHVADSETQGVLHHITRGRKELAIVTSFRFPEWLKKNGLERSGAIEFAGLYVNSYALVISSLLTRSSRTERSSFEKSFQPEIWTPPYDTGTLSLPYRLAAGLALNAAGIEPFVPQSTRPHTAHVASLANPLSTEHVRTLISGIQ